MPNKSTAAKKSAFLLGISTGLNFSDAANYAEISRQTAYDWERKDATFRADLQSAREARLGQVKDKIFEGAMAGSERLLIYLDGLWERALKARQAAENQSAAGIGEIVIVLPGDSDGEHHDFLSIE